MLTFVRSENRNMVLLCYSGKKLLFLFSKFYFWCFVLLCRIFKFFPTVNPSFPSGFYLQYLSHVRQDYQLPTKSPLFIFFSKATLLPEVYFWASFAIGCGQVTNLSQWLKVCCVWPEAKLLKSRTWAFLSPFLLPEWK